MKFKISFGKDGFKGFLARHAEKAIFGVVLALVAVFVFSSATQQGAVPGKDPAELQRLVGTAKTNVSKDSWDQLAPDRVNKVEDYPRRVDRVRNELDPAPYGYSQSWNPPLTPSLQKRRDPQLFKPEQVQADGGVYAVAFRTKAVWPEWDNDKEAVAKPEEKPKPKPKGRKPRGRPGGSPDMYGGGEDMYGGSGSRMPAGYPGAGTEMGESVPAPGAGMYGAGAARRLGQFYIQHYLRDSFQVGGGGGMPGGGAVPGLAAKSFAVVAVKALVPLEQQWGEYERALAEATGYSPAHDIPKYLWYEAERAEVTDPAAPLDQLEWKPISRTDVAMKTAMQFAGFPQEVADEMYLLPGTLTMPIPPILLKPCGSLALHSEIPKKKLQQQMTPSPEAEAKPDESGAKPKPDEPPDLTDVPEMPKTPAGQAPGMGGMGYPGGEMGPGMGMMPSSGYPGMSGMTPGYPGASPDSMMGSGSTAPGYGTGMYGSGMPGYGQTGMQQPLVKYKLVRFFDFTAESGKTYVYRVRVVLEDPNRPVDLRNEPNSRILDQAVTDRLATVAAADQDISKRTGKPFRTFFVKTDWSAACTPVTIPKHEQYVGGSATAGKRIPVFQGVEVETTEAEGKLVAAVWDMPRAAEIPVEKTVNRGSFLDFTSKADALHPLTLQIRTIEDYPFDTDAFVIDLRGGEELMKDKPTDKEVKEQQKEETVHFTPGEFLVVDGDGNLQVCNEIADAEEFRRLLFIEDQPGGTMPGGGMGMPGASPDYGGMMDYFGGSGSSAGSGSRGGS